ncbi:MAG TPA: cobaltochelatase subunit CobN, partial [Pyrinomonadaceae bacterium]|nr:cobaltochelatase subunit CobN [Pyrinomonadaceae bacterium]
MNVTVLYVGSSLLAPLKNAEREINRVYDLDLRVAAYNFGSPLNDGEWRDVDRDLSQANVVFVIHVMDGENASRLVTALESYQPDAVVVINCMPDLMRLTRMGKLDVGKFAGWMGRYVKSEKKDRKHRHHHYLKLIDRLPTILKFVPTAGALTDAKHYLYLFCYFLQPTPANIQSMLLYSLKHYVRDDRLRAVKTSTPQQVRSVAVYHPDARELFETFEAYEKWHKSKKKKPLDPDSTLGLLLMRPQVVSKTTKHYDALIHAIEDEGLSVIPAIATLMDNREAVSKFFHNGSKQISQIISLTGFSFVGGPAMNDSAAASQFLSDLNLPYRSAVSLDTQTIEAWRDSATGLNPIQAGMQIAIPEIDGATEPFIYGGIPVKGHEPTPLDDRCRRFARRLKRWNNLQTSPRDEVKLAIVLFCFPPNKGNIGTAADLDVFPSVWDLLQRLEREGYRVEVPATADELRERLLGGNSEQYGAAANVDYRMTV